MYNHNKLKRNPQYLVWFYWKKDVCTAKRIIMLLQEEWSDMTHNYAHSTTQTKSCNKTMMLNVYQVRVSSTFLMWLTVTSIVHLCGSLFLPKASYHWLPSRIQPPGKSRSSSDTITTHSMDTQMVFSDNLYYSMGTFHSESLYQDIKYIP